MFGILVAGVVGYYAGLYTFLWSQLAPNQYSTKNEVNPTNYLKYEDSMYN